MRRYHRNYLEDDFSINLSNVRRFSPPTQHQAQVDVPVTLPRKPPPREDYSRDLPFNTYDDIKTGQEFAYKKKTFEPIKITGAASSPPPSSYVPPPSSSSTKAPQPPPPVFTEEEKKVLLKPEPGFEDVYVEFDSKYRIRTGTNNSILRNENKYFSFRLTQNKSNVITSAGGLSIGYPLEQVIEVEMGSIVVPNFFKNKTEQEIYKRVYLVIEEFSDRQVIETSTSSSWADKHFVFDIKPFYIFDPISKLDIIDEQYLLLNPVKDKITFKRPVDKVDNFTFVFVLGEQPIKFESDLMIGDVSLGPTTRLQISLPEKHELKKDDIIQFADSRSENYIFQLYPELKTHYIVDPKGTYPDIELKQATIDNYKNHHLSQNNNFIITNTSDEYYFNVKDSIKNYQYVIFENPLDLSHTKVLDRIHELAEEIDHIILDNKNLTFDIESKKLELDLNTSLIEQNNESLLETNQDIYSIKSGYTITHNVLTDWDNNHFLIDKVPMSTGSSLKLYKGNIYVFIQTDVSNFGNEFKFSETLDGTHNGGIEYTSNILVEGIPATSESRTIVNPGASTPNTLYVYSSVQAGMGFEIEVLDALVTNLHDIMLSATTEVDNKGNNYRFYNDKILELETVIVPGLDDQIVNTQAQITIKENEENTNKLEILNAKLREKALAQISLDTMIHYKNETNYQILKYSNLLNDTQYERYNKLNLNASLTSNTDVYLTVKVQGGKFYINNVSNPNIKIYRGNTYHFLQNDISNNSFLLRFSESSDNSGNNEWINDVSFSGVPGVEGAYTSISVTNTTPNVLHYYNDGASGMGNSVAIELNYEEYLTQEINNNELEKSNLDNQISDHRTEINALKNYISNIVHIEYIFEIELSNNDLYINNQKKPILYLIRGVTYRFRSVDIIFRDISNNIYNNNIITGIDEIEFTVDAFTDNQLKYEHNGIANSGNDIQVLDQTSVTGQLWLSYFFQFYYETYLNSLTQKQKENRNQIEFYKWTMLDHNNTFLWSEQIDDGAGNITTNRLASSIPDDNYTIYELLNKIEQIMNNDSSLNYNYSVDYDRYSNDKFKITLLNGNGNADSGFRIDFGQDKLFDTLFTTFDNSFQNALTNDYTPNPGFNGDYENHNHIIKRPFQIESDLFKEIICAIEINAGQQRINIICREYDPTTNGYNKISNNNSIILPGGIESSRKIYLTRLNWTSSMDGNYQYFLVIYTYNNITYYNLCNINLANFVITPNIETMSESLATSRYYLSEDIDLWHEGMDLKDADNMESHHCVVFFRRWQESTSPFEYKYQYVGLEIDTAAVGTKIRYGGQTPEEKVFGTTYDASSINCVNGCIKMNENTQLLFSIQFWSVVNDEISNMFQLVEYHSTSGTPIRIVLTKIEKYYSSFNSNNAFFPINNNLFVWVGRNFQIRNTSEVADGKLIILKLYNIQPSNINTEFESATLLDYSTGTEHMLDTSAGSYLANNLFFIMQAHYENSKKFIKQILFEINPLSFDVNIKQTFTKTLTDEKEAYYLLGYSSNHTNYYTHPFTFYYYPVYKLYQWMIHHRVDSDHNNVIRMVIVDELIQDEKSFSFNLDKRILGEEQTYNITSTFKTEHISNNSVWDSLLLSPKRSEIENAQKKINHIIHQINQINYIDNSIKYYTNSIENIEQHIKTIEHKIRQLKETRESNEHLYKNNNLTIGLLVEKEKEISNFILELQTYLTQYDGKVGIWDSNINSYISGYGHAYKILVEDIKVLTGAGGGGGGASLSLKTLYGELSNLKNQYNAAVQNVSEYKTSLNDLLLITSLNDTSPYKITAESLLNYNIRIDELNKNKTDTVNILADLNDSNYKINKDLTNMQYTVTSNESIESYKTDAMRDLLDTKMSEAIGKWYEGGENDNAINRVYLQNITIPEVPFIITKRRFSIFMRIRVLVIEGQTNYISL